MKAKISVVINTLNEEDNIANAIRSVTKWADEVVVVDMYSNDATCSIAQNLDATIYSFERVGFVEPARAFAVNQTHNNWVLILDADEMVTFALSEALQQIALQDSADVVMIPRLNYDLSKPMMHSGSGPDQDRQTRFFKKGYLNIGDQIHSGLHPVKGARVRKLNFSDGAYLAHFGFLDTSLYLEKLMRYTNVEAVQAYQRGERVTTIGMFLKAAKVFLHRYILCQGYRDGWRGLNMALFLFIYRVATFCKLRQLQSVGDIATVRAACQKVAEQIVDSYQRGK